MFSVGLVGDFDYGIVSMCLNGLKMIIRMGGRN